MVSVYWHFSRCYCQKSAHIYLHLSVITRRMTWILFTAWLLVLTGWHERITTSVFVAKQKRANLSALALWVHSQLLDNHHTLWRLYETFSFRFFSPKHERKNHFTCLNEAFEQFDPERWGSLSWIMGTRCWSLAQTESSRFLVYHMTESETQERFALLQLAFLTSLHPSMYIYCIHTHLPMFSAHENGLAAAFLRSHMSGIRLISDESYIMLRLFYRRPRLLYSL